MTETCEGCTCGIGDEEIEDTRVGFGALSVETQEVIRQDVLDRLDFSEDDLFINEVVVCPEKTTVTYEDRS